jgi:hypothetical protein
MSTEKVSTKQKGNNANRVLATGLRFKRVTLQMVCDSCFEILNQENYKVECDRLGVPFLIRLEALFNQPQFQKPNHCSICESKQIKYYIGYSPDNIEENCDLPF